MSVRSITGPDRDARQAAGLAKVPIAVDLIDDWVKANTVIDADGRELCDRPMVVWAHHREVAEALAAAVPKTVGNAGVIIGGTSVDERGRLVDEFQAGRIPVMVCSIHAAGVGITLTRSHDVVMVETDWTPAVVVQAEDRCYRRGQIQSVTVTTLLAVDTLDERIHATLSKKIEVLDGVMPGSDHHVAASTGDAVSHAEVLAGLVWDRIHALKAQAA